MIRVVESNAGESQLHQALVLLGRFQQHGDTIRVDKAISLIKKMQSKELITAFSGHFSAGKSTMINALVGEQLLPSSPIPTSANLVKVHQSDKNFAKIYYENKKPLLFNEPYDFETVKQFCKNGDVREIEIGNKNSILPSGITIMDTPGVDSTENAHRISTESALHLADVVFYVMDYNHVQSELNFTYTKNLLKHGVKLYLIINQIDKHNENELSFQQFKLSVIDSFVAWDVKPDGIFFTTLKNPEHPENEFRAVKVLIDDAFTNHTEWMERTVESAISRLIEEHNHWLDEQLTIDCEPFEEVLEPFTDAELAKVFADEQNLTDQIVQLEKSLDNWVRHFDADCEKLLRNAYLMPFETRELAEQFLISAQPNFKMGLFFSKKKTEEEKNSRLNSFSKSIRKQVGSQIDWHLKQLAGESLKNAELFQADLQHEAQSLAVSFDDSLFMNVIKKGATVNGDYVLHYCEDIANQLKKIARQVCDQFKTAVTVVLQKQVDQEVTGIKKSLNEVRHAANALRSIIEIEKEYEKKTANVSHATGQESELLSSLQNEWKIASENVLVYSGEQIESVNQATENISELSKTRNHQQRNVDVDVDDVISTLEKAYTHLQNEKGLKRIAEQLKEKATRLKNRNYTVALFGAFSAGKSSFANALLGESVLPVSPNPTTAAVNRICPPTNDHVHRTAKVYLKKEADLLADISQSLSMFGVDIHSLEGAVTQIPKILSNADLGGKEKVHHSFLTAFYEGYEQFKHSLGETITTDLTEFREFVGNEVQSCFVESIDLFYDCDFTRQGITLVDTPGADSINARHTGVAFEYIKNADAILFVTYYNHAFSKADREFLIQLGRVKDAFELDKMFFIINAIDLAHSEAELEEVITYVQYELVKHGVRMPKTFGISSKLALNEHEKEKSKINIFKKEFEYFLEQELTQMAVQSAEADVKRVIYMLDELIRVANEDQQTKNERKTELLHSQNTINEWLSKVDAHILSDRLVLEITELLHYVKQRVFFRFSDFFKEAFHPSVLTKRSKVQLQKALDELLESTGYDFTQELRATSLRLENYIRKLLHEHFSMMEKELDSIQKGMTISDPRYSNIHTPKFHSAFEQIDRRPLESTFRYYKDARSFFERNEKKKMEEELRQLLSPLADDYLNDEMARILKYYDQNLQSQFETMMVNLANDISEQFEVLLDALSNHDQAVRWRQIRSMLEVSK